MLYSLQTTEISFDLPRNVLHVIVVTWQEEFTWYIHTPKAWGPQAPGLMVYISDKPWMAMIAITIMYYLVIGHKPMYIAR